MGSHASMINLLEDVSKKLSDQYQFGYGAASDFDSIRDKAYPFIWLDPIRGGFPVKDSDGIVSDTITWEVSLNFLTKDDKQGNEKETAKTWDVTFDMMEKYIHKLDRLLLEDSTDDNIQSDTVTLSGISFTSRRKGTADLVSGWTLVFTLTTPSDFDYCSIYA